MESIEQMCISVIGKLIKEEVDKVDLLNPFIKHYHVYKGIRECTVTFYIPEQAGYLSRCYDYAEVPIREALSLMLSQKLNVVFVHTYKKMVIADSDELKRYRQSLITEAFKNHRRKGIDYDSLIEEIGFRGQVLKKIEEIYKKESIN